MKNEWKPIETIPKDERSILIYDSYFKQCTTISWCNNRNEWYDTYTGSILALDEDVTHWMPLPEPPKVAK